MTVTAVYALGASAAIAFAVWGSLFPFAVDPVGAGAAFATFMAAWGRGPLSWSVSDFTSNVLLFVPIGLFGTAMLQARGMRWRYAAAAIFAMAATLSVSLELGQAFIRWRTSSVVDVLAEQLGALIGAAAWSAGRAHMDAWVERACASFVTASATQRVLLVYCAVFAIAWLIPFDVTLRPNEIADKAYHKRLLLPFTPSPDAASTGELMMSLLAAVPVGAAVSSRFDRRESIQRAVRLALPAVVLLEVGQVFVFSRTTDSTVLLPVAAGVLAGAWVGSR